MNECKCGHLKGEHGIDGWCEYGLMEDGKMVYECDCMKFDEK